MIEEDVRPPDPVLTGDQFNYHFYSVSEPPSRRVSRHLHVGDLAWLFRRFEPPPGHATALAVLAEHHIVVLDGLPGMGRRTAATMLLRAYADRAHRFQELSTDSGPSSLDNASVAKGDLLLLDLTAVDIEGYQQIQRVLPAFRASARDMGAKLVIVERHEVRDQLDAHLRQFRVELGRPDPLFVLRRHLVANGVTWRAGQWPSVAGLDEVLRAASMQDIAALAELAGTARDATLVGRLKAAVEASGDRAAEVEAAIDGSPDGRSRALLFAAAMLEGSRLPAVYRATEILVEVAEHPPDETPVLEREPVPVQLRRLGATVEPDGQIWFTKLGYSTAVIRYFWDNRIDLRFALRDWAEHMAVLPELSAVERDDVVERVAEQCLRVDRPEDLVVLAQHWLRSTGRDTSRQLYRLLQTGLLNERWGPQFRRLLYDWAAVRSLSDRFATVLTKLCTEVLAPTRPEQALVRLHRLAKRMRYDLDPVATAQLLALTESDDRLLRHLFDRVRYHPVGARWRAEFLLFFEAATPARLTDVRLSEPDLRRAVTLGWFDAMSSPDVPWQENLSAWLDAGLEAADPAVLLSIPAEAAVAAGRAGEVYRLAAGWAKSGTDPTTRVRLARVLTGIVDQAQGISL